MADLTLRNVLKEFGLRLGAALVVVGAFLALGYANRTDFLGLSGLLGDQFTFFVVAFLTVGAASLGWMVLQSYRS